jgi:DNA-directed RNA polymerase I, II, and III subunit RPABC2
LFNDLSDDEDDNEEDDENYLQKIDESLQQQIVSEYHPELQSHTYDEIESMSRVVRDQRGNVVDPLHQTLPFITRYEKARILGERAKQINAGAKPFIKVDASVIDGYLIALSEFEQKKIPFIIKRPMPNGGCEYWKLSDLEILV